MRSTCAMAALALLTALLTATAMTLLLRAPFDASGAGQEQRITRLTGAPAPRC